jgi:hypothetical protein
MDRGKVWYGRIGVSDFPRENAMIPGVEVLSAPPLTRWQRYLNVAVFGALVLIAARLVTQALINATGRWPIDAWNYWQIWHGPMYIEGARLFEKGNIYSPAFAVPMWPLAQLPWPVFATAWSAAAFAAYAWLLRPVSLVFRLPLLAACLLPISAGNIEWLLGLVLVIGGPAGWAVPALTKITPALVGPVWYAARQDWRNLTIALGVPLVIVLVSFALTPSVWLSWVAVLLDSVRLSPTGGALMPPLVVRLPAAALLTVWAAYTDRTWVLPVAMIVAQPDPTWTTGGLLAAVPRLAGLRWRQDTLVQALRPVGLVLLAAAAVGALVLIRTATPELDWSLIRPP